MIELLEEKRGNVLLLRIKGRLDAVTSHETEKMILSHIDSGSHLILLNFSQANYLSSAGLRTILTIAKKLKEENGKLILSHLAPNVMEVMKISGFNHLLLITATDEEALKKF